MARKNPEKAAEIKENIRKWLNYWRDNIITYDEWTQFVKGDQWLDDESQVFAGYQKIPMTVNKVKPLMNHLKGEQQQNTPELQVEPDETCDEQTAEVREGLIKQITFESNSKQQYQIAFENSIVGGYSVLYVYPEYERDDSFEQGIRVAAAHMPNRCFFDMAALKVSKTDGMFSGWRNRVSRAKVRAEYGIKVEGSIGYETVEDGIGTVLSDDESVTVIDYFERIPSPETLRKLSNGRDVGAEEFKMLEEIEIDGKKLLLDNGEVVSVVQTRRVPKYKIKHYKFCGEYELESTDFPSKQLPVVYVDMSSFYNKDGAQVTASFFKEAYDAQRFLNYLATQFAYLVKIARYEQFLISNSNIRGQDTQLIWRDPTNVQGALRYDASPDGSKPEKLAPAELPQSLLMQYERCLQDIQTSTGMYNTQIGERGNEVSGRAIDSRTKRGAYATFGPFNSLNMAIGTVGEIINEMIPYIYDTERTVTVNLKDKGETAVRINQPVDMYGSQIRNDMTKGTFKVKIVAGPGLEGQRQENLESMQSVLQAYPQAAPLILDLYVENQPMANNLEMRNRLRTMVPPEVIEAGKTGQMPPPKPPEPNPQMIMAQAKMQELQLKQQEIQMKQQQLQLEAQQTGHDIEIKYAQLEAQKLEAAAALQEMELRYSAEMQRTMTDEQMNHANNLVKILTSKGQENGNSRHLSTRSTAQRR